MTEIERLFDVFDSTSKLGFNDNVFVASYYHQDDPHCRIYWASITEDSFRACQTMEDYQVLYNRCKEAGSFLNHNYELIENYSANADMIEGSTGCRLRSELNRIIECGKLPWMDHYPEYLYNNFLDELLESENNSGQFYASVYLFQRIFPSPICLKNLWSCSYTCCWYMWANTPVSNYLKMLRNRIGIFPSVPCYFDRPARTKIFPNYQSFLSQYKSKIDSVLSRYSLEDFERQGEQYFLEHKVASEPEQRKQNEESLYW